MADPMEHNIPTGQSAPPDGSPTVGDSPQELGSVQDDGPGGLEAHLRDSDVEAVRRSKDEGFMRAAASKEDNSRIESMKAAEATQGNGLTKGEIARIVAMIVAMLFAIVTFGIFLRPVAQWFQAGPPAQPVGAVNPDGGAGPTLDSHDGTPAAASPSAACALELLDPPPAGIMPESGPFTFKWTEVPRASSYSLEVIPPAGGGPPWVIPISDNSKTLYLENFPAAGEYEVWASALSSAGDPLCAATLKFTKAASDAPVRASKDAGGGGAAPCFNPNSPGSCP